MIEFMQPDAYSCGVNAVAFLLYVLGRAFSIAKLRSELGPTLREGTSPQMIEKYLRSRGIRFNSGQESDLAKLKPPCLVIYTYLADGHYGVILSITAKHVSIFEPWQAKIHLYTRRHFEKQWKSRLHQDNRWSLTVI